MRTTPISKTKLPLRQKAALVTGGIFFCLIFLEIGLRLGGGIMLFLQERHNRVSLEKKGAYRIMCLGESTTALGGNSSYPYQLEEILNQRSKEVTFSVVNKGISGVSTSFLISQLEPSLHEYKPDMVVTMMGVNDSGEHIPYESSAAISKLASFYKSLRTRKLIRLLWLHMVSKVAEMDPRKMENREVSHIASEKYQDYIKLGKIYNDQGEFNNAEKILKKAIMLFPANAGAYIELGRIYQERGASPEAEEILKTAIQLSPNDSSTYLELSRLYKGKWNITAAEKMIKRAIELDPGNAQAYIELNLLYRSQRNLIGAQEILKRAIEINSYNADTYFELGVVYSMRKSLLQAEEAFLESLELNPKKDETYLELVWLYLSQGKFMQAQELLSKGVAINTSSERLFAALANICRETGKPELMQEYYDKVKGLRSSYYNSLTVNNYRKLKIILDRRKIQYVCCQYPLRSIEPLKRIFKEEKGVIFVDNEQIFKEALLKASQEEYFSDMFAGDFGHCTHRGNRLLAGNIADTILKEVFKK